MIHFPSEKLIHNETQRLIENTSEYVYDLMLQDVFLNRHRKNLKKKTEKCDFIKINHIHGKVSLLSRVQLCDPMDCSLPGSNFLFVCVCVCPWDSPRQEYWNGLPFPSPWDLPDPEIEPWSPTSQVDSLPTEPQGKPHSYMKKENLNNFE